MVTNKIGKNCNLKPKGNINKKEDIARYMPLCFIPLIIFEKINKKKDKVNKTKKVSKLSLVRNKYKIVQKENNLFISKDDSLL